MENDDFKPTGEVQTLYGSDFKLVECRNYIEGVDELAQALGVEPTVDMSGITIRAKSGNNYSLTEMLMAHIDMMTKTLERTND